MSWTANIKGRLAPSSLSFESRLSLTLLGLFMLVFIISMISVRYTKSKLHHVFGEIQARNLLAAEKNLEQNLISWQSSLSILVSSTMFAELSEFHRYGLSHEESNLLESISPYLRQAEKVGSGLTNTKVTFDHCKNDFEISKDLKSISICANHPSAMISLWGEVPLSFINRSIREFMPEAEINTDPAKKNLSAPLRLAPLIAIKLNTSNTFGSIISSFSQILPMALMTLFIGILGVLFVFWSKFLRAQSNAIKYIKRAVTGDVKLHGLPDHLGFSDLENTMKDVVQKIIALEQNKKEMELLSLSKQISHDIRSPLTALNLLSHSLTELPEDKRILVRHSIHRINDIANSLLDKARQKIESEPAEKDLPGSIANEVVMISSLIDSIVSEKRIQLIEWPGLHIESKIDRAYGLFVFGSGAELKRVISNLVNNAFEAFSDKRGEITVQALNIQDSIEIVIKDNGCGIPDELMTQIGQKGFSFGKSDRHESGTGLGVYHAKQTIQSLGGHFTIDSRLGLGTRICIRMPKAPSPPWFVDSLNLNSNQTLVVCDDDISIHQIWTRRLQSLGMENNLLLISFTSGSQFTEWIELNLDTNFICLMDYELLGQENSGLDLIEKLNIQDRSILVTSQYDEPQIKQRCQEGYIKLIPKDMAAFVPIILSSEPSDIDAKD